MEIISLFSELAEGILKAEEIFFQNPKEFSKFETQVRDTFTQSALKFIENTLNETDEIIRNSVYRKKHYDIQRHDQRTLITTVGDVVFNQTLYKRRSDGSYRYLLPEILGMETHERFSEAAEADIIAEAIKTSYAEAAKVLPSQSKITKTTVMNKVHGITEDIPQPKQEEKKDCKILYIEADEDHIAEQHGNIGKEDNSSFISRLAYIYESREEVCKGRYELNGKYYKAGVYEGQKGVEKFWKELWEYINESYDISKIEKIYISGDGAGWIKSGTEYIPDREFVLDKFHLSKYILKASSQMLDEANICRSEIYRMLHKNKKKELEEYIDRMARSAENTDSIEKLRTYVISNWKGIQKALKDENVKHGCSAEGHVSHVLSDRMSSRPMGWSKVGADRMSKLRCYVRNEGEGKIIDLIKYSRQQRLLKRTGTDDEIVIDKVSAAPYISDNYNQARSYIDRLQATIPGNTYRKAFAIQYQMKLI